MRHPSRNKRKVSGIYENGRLPHHIAIFMDGNGRWAVKRGLPRSAGHREGANTLKRIVRLCNEIGIEFLTVYAFSTENWTRPKEEVDTLMSLLLEFLKNADKELAGQDIKIIVIGKADPLGAEIKKEIARVTANTASNTGLTLVIALNYGSRAEITNAAVRIAEDVLAGKLKIENINENLVSDYLYTAGLPDPDLVIRPSGENRLSNFLLWQSSYSEFLYSDILWPDFSERHLLESIKEYQRRLRRFGGL